MHEAAPWPNSIFTGDHGSHFSAVPTVYNESCMHGEYGIEPHIVSLASYHCFNRCRNILDIVVVA